MKIRLVAANLFHTDRRTDKWTDTIKLIADFRNYAAALKNWRHPLRKKTADCKVASLRPFAFR